MKQLTFDFPLPDGYMIIFRSSITLKNGTKLYAHQRGLKAFPLLVPISKA